MNAALPDADLCALLILGLGAPLMGLVRWANRPLLGIGVTSLFSIATLATLIAGGSIKIWLPCSILAIVYPAAVAAGHYRDTLLRWLASRRAAAISLVAVGPILAGAWAAWIDDATSAPLADVSASREAPAVLPEPVPVSITGYTDLGHVVPLSTRPFDDVPATTLHQAERLLTTGHPEALIRTAGSDPTYNCHGWVFASGQFWIRNDAVESILTDNGYQSVEKPKTGDVIVYRDGEGRVIHTGLVRMSSNDLTLVESKWGHVGRFLHPAAEQPYGETWAFYRSQRRGHLVRVGDTPSSNEGVGE